MSAYYLSTFLKKELFYGRLTVLDIDVEQIFQDSFEEFKDFCRIFEQNLSVEKVILHHRSTNFGSKCDTFLYSLFKNKSVKFLEIQSTNLKVILKPIADVLKNNTSIENLSFASSCYRHQDGPFDNDMMIGVFLYGLKCNKKIKEIRMFDDIMTRLSNLQLFLSTLSEHNPYIKVLRLGSGVDSDTRLNSENTLNWLVLWISRNNTITELDVSCLDGDCFSYKEIQSIQLLKKNKCLKKIIDPRGLLAQSLNNSYDIFEENCTLMEYVCPYQSLNFAFMLKRNRDMRQQIVSVILFFLSLEKKKIIPFGKDVSLIVSKMIWESRFDMKQWNY